MSFHSMLLTNYADKQEKVSLYIAMMSFQSQTDEVQHVRSRSEQIFSPPSSDDIC